MLTENRLKICAGNTILDFLKDGISTLKQSVHIMIILSLENDLTVPVKLSAGGVRNVWRYVMF
mgnify:CR=1 FL=1